MQAAACAAQRSTCGVQRGGPEGYIIELYKICMCACLSHSVASSQVLVALVALKTRKAHRNAHDFDGAFIRNTMA